MSNLAPEGWSILKLKDISTLITKGTTPKKYISEGINFIKVESVTKSSELIPSKFAKIDISTHESFKRSQLHNGDILFSIAGSLGRLAVINSSHLPANTNQAFAIIRLIKHAIDPTYCAQQLKSEEIQIELKNLQTVGAQPNLSLQQVSDISVKTPSLPEQQKIAKILTSVDEVIEKTQAQIDKLKDLKTGMMQELLTNGIGHTEFKDSPVGKIPAEWKVVTFSYVLKKIDSGWSPSCTEVPPAIGKWGVLKVSSVTRGEFLEIQSKELPPLLEPKHHIQVNKGDILLTRANGVADLVGKCVMVREEPKRKLMMSDKLLRLIPNENIDSEFLLHSFNSERNRKQIELSWGGSSGQKNISQVDIKSYKLALPTLKEQKSISKNITNIERSIFIKNKKMDSLKNVKKALMQDLLTGKVRVKVDSK